MGVGFICPIEGHLVVDQKELCSTQVEPSSTQVQQASPEEATNAPTEEQDNDLHEEEGEPPSSLVIQTASNSSQEQDQPTHEDNDDQGQDGDQNDQDDQVIPQSSNVEIEARRKRRVERNLELRGHTLERVIGDLRGKVSTQSQWLNPRKYLKHLKIQIGCMLCMKNSRTSSAIMCGC
jgi:hypothetical protein